MDIKDGFTTSSKEQLRSLVRVHELDEITFNGGKDQSVTKEHPWGLKRKRSDFMQRVPPSWTWGWHCQNSASGGGKVRKCMRTHRSEWATEPGLDGPGLVGPSRPAWPSPRVGSPPFPCNWRIFNPEFVEAPPFARESRSHREAIQKLEREEGELRRRITQLERSTHKWRRRKTPSEASPWSTVSMGCNRSWDVIVLYWTSIYHHVLNMLYCLRLATMP
jgi:hypothetical protein